MGTRRCKLSILGSKLLEFAYRNMTGLWRGTGEVIGGLSRSIVVVGLLAVWRGRFRIINSRCSRVEATGQLVSINIHDSIYTCMFWDHNSLHECFFVVLFVRVQLEMC